MPHWTWIAAAYRGISHEKTGTRLQDSFRCLTTGKNGSCFLLSVISDGAGSAKFGGQGASIVCRTVAVAARTYLLKFDAMPDDITIDSWIDMARDSIFYAATKRGLAPRDFAATVIAVISSSNESVVIHIGDGCAVLKDQQAGEWFTPSWPNHGEYASTTYFITDESELQLRIKRNNRLIEGVALFSDGLERLALDFKQKKAFPGFFEGISKPLIQSNSTGKNMRLSAALKSYLNSDVINSRTDDDKSLIVAVLK